MGDEDQRIRALPPPAKKERGTETTEELLMVPGVQESLNNRAEAFDVLSRYLGKLPQASMVIEVSSRSGHDITQLVYKFPDLQFLPTEGSGGTSHGHFLFIEQNVQSCEDSIQQQKNANISRTFEKRSSTKATSQAGDPEINQEEARCLKPRFMDIRKPHNWGLESFDYIGCIFCVDTLQYEPTEAITEFIIGCFRVLMRGGFVFLCGPFIDNGNASDVNFSLNVALKHYVKKSMDDDSGLGPRLLPWGLPDSKHICDLAKSLGMEIHQQKVGKEWLALILRKPR